MKSRDDTAHALPTIFPSLPIYIAPVVVPNNFFRLPVAEPKLAATNFFSYVRSPLSLTRSIPSETWVVLVTGILAPTNSYGVPARRLSWLLVLVVGV